MGELLHSTAIRTVDGNVFRDVAERIENDHFAIGADPRIGRSSRTGHDIGRHSEKLFRDGIKFDRFYENKQKPKRKLDALLRLFEAVRHLRIFRAIKLVSKENTLQR